MDEDDDGYDDDNYREQFLSPCSHMAPQFLLEKISQGSEWEM